MREGDFHVPAYATDPEIAMGVNRGLAYLPQTTLGIIDRHMDEPLGGGIEEVHAAVGDHPHALGTVHVDPVHGVLGDGRGILRIVAEGGERVTVVPVQSILGGEPHETVLVLCDGRHHTL